MAMLIKAEMEKSMELPSLDIVSSMSLSFKLTLLLYRMDQAGKCKVCGLGLAAVERLLRKIFLTRSTNSLGLNGFVM